MECSASSWFPPDHASELDGKCWISGSICFKALARIMGKVRSLNLTVYTSPFCSRVVTNLKGFSDLRKSLRPSSMTGIAGLASGPMRAAGIASYIKTCTEVLFFKTSRIGNPFQARFSRRTEIGSYTRHGILTTRCLSRSSDALASSVSRTPGAPLAKVSKTA